ncbi:hypothetical protein JCGZ_22020 [Jatropha curcas]|uniref:BRCT domain-containing protein n=1 Tax=Jatropha curcas TaxID=180498 RepID=A0A067JPU6_JATCU|nr:hypothetical protein JCGZ_22020 [Jatropha curcas]
MADHCNIEAEVLNFRSQSPSGSGRKDAMEGDHQLFQDTEPLYDTVVLDSYFDATQLETLDFVTQVVNGDDCIKGVRPHEITEYEEEVVLDTEDEGNCFAANGMSVYKTDRRRESQKGWSCQASYGSAGDTDLPQMLACDRPIDDEEPRESSQAKALNFVNHYLSLNNVDLSPGAQPRNAARKKVSPVSSKKGCQSLSKQIKARNQAGKVGTFEWIDDSKRTDACFGLGASRQRSENQKASHADSKGGSSTGNKCEEKSISLNEEVTSSPLSDLRISGYSPKKMSRIEQGSLMDFKNNSAKHPNEQLHEVQLVQEMDTFGIERNAPDMSDVGFSTQMAAEAMEALAYGLSTNSSAGDVHHCLQNLQTDSSTVVTKTKTHSKRPFPKGGCSNLEGVARTSKQRKSSVRKGTSSSSLKHKSNQELDNKLTIATKRKRSQSSAGRLNGMNTTHPNEHSAGKNPKPAKERKEEKGNNKNDRKEIENYGSLSMTFENILLGKQCFQGKPVAYQTESRMTEGTLGATKDGRENVGQMKNDIMNSGIVAFTYKRKRSRLGTEPSDMLDTGGKHTKLCCNQLIQGEAIAHQSDHSRTGGHLEETKDGPSNSRKGMNDIMKDSLITYKRKSLSNAKLSEVSNAEEKHAKFCCNIPEVARNNKSTQQNQRSLEVASLTSYLNLNAWMYPKGKRTLRKRPRHSNGANNQYTSFIAINRKGDYKKPFNKNLPKSSFLKELIRLGIPDPKPDSKWKDLRNRRDKAYVQVLFSQHLDDDIIKQQKKILGRLGISIASCSMNATHFIADKFVRTRNMLETIAVGKPVVNHLWLESCGQANCLIDEKNYILRDAKKEKEIGFSMPISLARASQHPLLKGRRILITPNIKPEKEMITSLVKAVHGQVVEKDQISALKIPENLLILTCKEDHAICLPFLNKGAAAYSSELLLNGIVIQKLEYERSCLF